MYVSLTQALTSLCCSDIVDRNTFPAVVVVEVEELANAQRHNTAC